MGKNYIIQTENILGKKVNLCVSQHQNVGNLSKKTCSILGYKTECFQFPKKNTSFLNKYHYISKEAVFISVYLGIELDNIDAVEHAISKTDIVCDEFVKLLETFNDDWDEVMSYMSSQLEETSSSVINEGLNEESDGVTKQINNDPSLNHPIINKYGLREYRIGHLSGILKSKEILETYNKFGLTGVLLHTKLFSHFSALDEVARYFKTSEITKDDSFKKYTLSDIPKLLSDKKLSQSTEFTNNITTFLDESLREKGEDPGDVYNLTAEMSCGGVDTSTFLGGRISTPVYPLIRDDSGLVGSIYEYLLDLNGSETLNGISREVVGFNQIFFVTAFRYIWLRKSGKDYFVSRENFVGDPSISSRSDLNMDQRFEVSNWNDIYRTKYLHYKEEILTKFKDSYYEEIDHEGVIYQLKRDSFEILKNDEKKSREFSYIYRHINSLQDEVEDTFSLMFEHREDEHYLSIRNQGGFLHPYTVEYLCFEHIFNKFFEMSFILNTTGLMVDYLKEGDEFTYSELYLLLEPFHIFDKTIEKKTLSKLEDISMELRSINDSLSKINSSIIKGFGQISKHLKDIDNKLWYNNVLTTINTYQLYKIRKK